QNFGPLLMLPITSTCLLLVLRVALLIFVAGLRLLFAAVRRALFGVLLDSEDLPYSFGRSAIHAADLLPRETGFRKLVDLRIPLFVKPLPVDNVGRSYCIHFADPCFRPRLAYLPQQEPVILDHAGCQTTAFQLYTVTG